MKKFLNKQVLITGSSRGIGRALVDYFVNQGAKVYSVSRNMLGDEYNTATHLCGGGRTSR